MWYGDIICGTESWLSGIKPGKDPEHNAIKSSEVFPPTHAFYRNDRETTGSGVFVGVRKDMTSESQPSLTTECEVVWTKAKIQGSRDLYIASFYMPHRHLDSIRKLGDSLQKLLSQPKEKHIVLAGDFNCPDIDWEHLTVRKGAPDREVQQALIDIATDYGLTQIHDQPTRLENILDLVLTNNPSLVKTSTSIPGISDHAMVVTDFCILPQLTTQNARRLYVFSKADWKKIHSEASHLSTIILERKKQGDDICSLWTTFKTSLSHIIDESVPSRTTKRRKSLPWFNHKLKRMVRRKARLYKQAKRSNDWGKFKDFQRKCKRAFRIAEEEYVNTSIITGLDNNNSKPFWRYVKAKRQDRTGLPPLKKDGKLLHDSKDKAQILVKQFESVFKKASSDLPTTKSCKHQIEPLTVTVEGVEKLLAGINISKAVGPDNIPNIILKECSKDLAPGLTEIFQLSVLKGTLPPDWGDRIAKRSPDTPKRPHQPGEVAETWGMTFNTSKCKILSINSKSTHFYRLQDQILKQVPVSEHPYLGVTLNEKLSWSPHVAKTARKANAVLALLRRNLGFCPKNCKRTAYTALVRSIMEYGAIVWDPYLMKDIDSLEKIQRRGARFITGDYQSRDPGSMTQMLTNLDLHTLASRRRCARLSSYFKVVGGRRDRVLF
ncbi:uncharacterized protein [Diadema antillarum]|uniref:uncharacterized protein n=1 Tax=Diadema antillarum TaxID=105358 RepID=UPI003A83F6F2